MNFVFREFKMLFVKLIWLFKYILEIWTAYKNKLTTDCTVVVLFFYLLFNLLVRHLASFGALAFVDVLLVDPSESVAFEKWNNSEVIFFGEWVFLRRELFQSENMSSKVATLSKITLPLYKNTKSNLQKFRFGRKINQKWKIIL